MNTHLEQTKDWEEINMNLLILALAFVGVLSIIFFIWASYEIYKDEQAEKVRKANEPVYTPEEEFYASLLQQKSDLDADAFATQKAMLDEFLRHNKNQH